MTKQKASCVLLLQVDLTLGNSHKRYLLNTTRGNIEIQTFWTLPLHINWEKFTLPVPLGNWQHIPFTRGDIQHCFCIPSKIHLPHLWAHKQYSLAIWGFSQTFTEQVHAGIGFSVGCFHKHSSSKCAWLKMRNLTNTARSKNRHKTISTRSLHVKLEKFTLPPSLGNSCKHLLCICAWLPTADLFQPIRRRLVYRILQR